MAVHRDKEEVLLCEIVSPILVFTALWLDVSVCIGSFGCSQCSLEIIQNQWLSFPATCFCHCSGIVFDSITASQGSAGTFRQCCCGIGVCCGLLCYQTFARVSSSRTASAGQTEPRDTSLQRTSEWACQKLYSQVLYSSEKNPLEMESRKYHYFPHKIFILKPCYLLWSTSNKLIQLSYFSPFQSTFQ